MEPLSPRRLGARAAAALLLWVGFWILALALVAALAWVPIAQLRYTSGLGLGGWVGGALAVTLLFALRPRGWFQRAEREPPPLSRDQHGALHAFVEKVASRMGVRAPDALVLVGQPTAFAMEKRRWLGLRRERRVGIGLPLLAVLEEDELASVICHELAHHAGGDVGLGPWVYRTRHAIGAAISELDGSAFFLDLPFRGYAQLFLRVSSSVSRAQETAADALAARTWGAAALARALEKVEALAPLWSAYLEHEALAALRLGVRVPLVEGFRRFLRAQPLRPEIQADLAQAAELPPSPWDTHPTLTQRIASVGERPRGTSLTLEGGCLHLVGGEAFAEETLYARWCDALPPYVRWEELAEKALVPARRKGLAAVRLPKPGASELGNLPKWIAEGAALWDRVRQGGLDVLSPEAKKRRAQHLLATWLSVALVDLGFRAEAWPGQALCLVRGTERVDPAAHVAALASGALSAEAHRVCVAEWIAAVSTPALGAAS